VPFSQDVPPRRERVFAPARAGVKTSEHARQKRAGHQIQRCVGSDVVADITARLAAFDDRLGDRAARQQNAPPKRGDPPFRVIAPAARYVS
jgi:hypothetical protein